MKHAEPVVVIIGAAGSLGRELAVTLHARQFPSRECRLLDALATMEAAADEDGDVGDVGAVEELDGADLRGVDLVFMCACSEVVRAWLPRAHAAGARVIDLTGTFIDRPDVPVVVPEVNADAVREDVDARLFANPLPAAIALSVALKPLDEMATLQRVVVAGYESVSGAGRAGVEELSRQTRDLMSGRSVDTVVFPHRIAFNLIPQVGAALGDGVSTAERHTEAQVRRLLDLPELPITVTSVRVPTFFGEGYAVNVQTEQPIDAASARTALRQAPGLLLLDEPQSSTYPTLTDAVEREATLVGRVRDDLSVPYGLNLWVVIDGLRKGSTVNAVQIAELLITLA